MCLGIPMKVVALEGDQGIVELSGVQHEASMQLMEDVALGDYVIVHAGFAIEKLNEKEALETLALIEEMFQAVDQAVDEEISDAVP